MGQAMTYDYWQKQTLDKPLFPDLLWSRPEQRSTAGKLLIVGGNLHSFAVPAEAFVEAERANVGTTRVLLPDAAKKLVGAVLEHVEYAPSTPSGSFSQQALAELLQMAAWADAVLIAGDLGRNSETAILLEKFLDKYSGQVTLAKDAVDYAIQVPQNILDRPDTLLVLSLAQLQKLAGRAGSGQAFTFNMDLLRFVESLQAFTADHQIHIIVQHHGQTHAASRGKIVSTPGGQDIWRVSTAAHASVWWLQNPSKPLEAFTSGIFEMLKQKQA